MNRQGVFWNWFIAQGSKPSEVASNIRARSPLEHFSKRMDGHPRRAIATLVPAMNRLLPVVLPLAIVLLLSGCARHYVITLTNGTRVTTLSKPKLGEGSYTFKDARGQPAAVPAGRVREIAPASMSKDPNSQFIK